MQLKKEENLVSSVCHKTFDEEKSKVKNFFASLTFVFNFAISSTAIKRIFILHFSRCDVKIFIIEAYASAHTCAL